jgi:ligand-binding SRPBCC domain-containing protein
MKYTHTFTVKKPRQHVADFHTSAEALKAVTPPPVIVQLHEAPPVLKDGDEMEFTLWMGPLPVRWRARIEQTSAGFIDRLVKGPFRSWAHHHQFFAEGGQATRVLDEIEFELRPELGWRLFGWLMALNLPVLFAFRGWKTRRMLETR